MEKLLLLLSKKFVGVAGITLLTTLTLGTSVIGINKVTSSLNSSKTKIPEIPAVEKQVNKTIEITPTNTVSSTKPGPTTILQPNNTSASLLANNNTVPAANGCIVTLFSQQYDVTSLRGSHPGGDIFVCGTDQSALYQNQHGTNMNQMQKYLVTAGSSSLGKTSSNSISGQENGKHDDKKDDDEEHYEEEKEEDNNLESLLNYRFTYLTDIYRNV